MGLFYGAILGSVSCDLFLRPFSGSNAWTIFWGHFLGPFSGAIFRGHFLGPFFGTIFQSMERDRRQPRKREKANSPLRRACSTPGSTVSWKIGHDMILYKIQRYHFWGHFLGPLSGIIFWDHCLGAFSGTIFWEHFPGPFSGSIAGTIFWDPSLENETYHVFFMTSFWLLHCEGFSSS